MEDERLVVLTTLGSQHDGERIARELVGRGLAACVNLVPGLVSIYRWKQAVEREPEVLLLIKTRRERFEALRRALVELHPYELPEVIALPVQAGHAPYLEWLDASVS
jgi:periplasmic divalent cation tolerance protein